MTVTSFAGLFPTGDIVITRGAQTELDQDCVFRGLLRHMSGDWGDLSEFVQNQNELALVHGERILSSFRTRNGTPFWIITEWDRSVTTILLPSEY